MKKINEFSKKSQVYLENSKKLQKLQEELEFPAEDLNNVDFIDIIDESSLNLLPKTGGVYFIVSNEPFNFQLHSQKLPRLNIEEIPGFRIIYIGKTTNFKGRIQNHLFSKEKSIFKEKDGKFIVEHSISALSLDILDQEIPENLSLSHFKDAMSQKSKVSKTKTELLNLLVDKEERSFVNNTNYPVYYFKNGINVNSKKHAKYKFRVYYIPIIDNPSYSEFIETKWQEKFGVPALCSHNGR